MSAENDFIAEGGLISKDGRDTTEAKKLGEPLPSFISTARAAGVLVVPVASSADSARRLTRRGENGRGYGRQACPYTGMRRRGNE